MISMSKAGGKCWWCASVLWAGEKCVWASWATPMTSNTHVAPPHPHASTDWPACGCRWHPRVLPCPFLPLRCQIVNPSPLPLNRHQCHHPPPSPPVNPSLILLSFFPCVLQMNYMITCKVKKTYPPISLSTTCSPLNRHLCHHPPTLPSTSPLVELVPMHENIFLYLPNGGGNLSPACRLMENMECHFLTSSHNFIPNSPFFAQSFTFPCCPYCSTTELPPGWFSCWQIIAQSARHSQTINPRLCAIPLVQRSLYSDDILFLRNPIFSWFSQDRDVSAVSWKLTLVDWIL